MATIEIIRDMVSMMMNTVTAIGPARVLPTGGKGGNGGNAVKQKQKNQILNYSIACVCQLLILQVAL